MGEAPCLQIRWSEGRICPRPDQIHAAAILALNLAMGSTHSPAPSLDNPTADSLRLRLPRRPPGFRRPTRAMVREGCEVTRIGGGGMREPPSSPRRLAGNTSFRRSQVLAIEPIGKQDPREESSIFLDERDQGIFLVLIKEEMQKRDSSCE